MIKNKMEIKSKINQLSTLLLISFTIASCSTYPSKFKCGDAKGLGCTMLSEVDRQIDSGKIEQVYKKCKGSKCNSLSDQDALVIGQKERASKPLEDSEDILDDDNNLYF